MAYCQAMLETGWLRFTGAVKADQHNYVGLGATGEVAGLSFPSVTAGVDAAIQHLYAYATTDPLPAGRPVTDPRFGLVRRGSAPNWTDLDGKWAVPGVGYGAHILHIYAQVVAARD